MAGWSAVRNTSRSSLPPRPVRPRSRGGEGTEGWPGTLTGHVVVPPAAGADRGPHGAALVEGADRDAGIAPCLEGGRYRAAPICRRRSGRRSGCVRHRRRGSSPRTASHRTWRRASTAATRLGRTGRGSLPARSRRPPRAAGRRDYRCGSWAGERSGPCARPGCPATPPWCSPSRSGPKSPRA